MATIYEIQDKIASVNAEVDQLTARQADLERQIADAWGSNTDNLEAEHARLTARRNAADQVINRLHKDLKAAELDALKDELCTAAIKAHELRLEADKAHNKLLKARQQLEQAERADREAQAWYSSAYGERLRLQGRFEQHGISQGEAQRWADEAVTAAQQPAEA